MPYGYHGTILHVNLTTGEYHIEHPNEAVYRTYMGGSALGLWYILREVKPGTDPLGPDNVLTFSNSVLTGTPVHGQSRTTANAKSPLTGGIGDSQAGGFWPAELKFAGFDAIVIRGRAPKPVYLWLHDGAVELRDATHLWGLDTGETMQRIREELGDHRIEVAAIGPAGENLVRYAAIMNMANRAFGRTGMGAVMGSKNLKAIAVRGKQRPALFDKDRVLELSRWGRDHVENIGALAKYGTSVVVKAQNYVGGLPTRNYSRGVFEHAKEISGQTMYHTILVDRDTCYACATKCKRVVEVKEGPYTVDRLYGGPEYETIATFGSYCEVGDLKAIAKANELCNRYGLDTISAGATIAWAMEAFENGALTLEETDGIELRFGNADAMLQALEALAHRRGTLGDLLAEGSARAAQRIGRGSDAFLITVKGQEAPAHMPQIKRSLGLIYAVNPFGADHQSSEHDTSYMPKSSKRDLERLAMLGLTSPQDLDALNREKVEFALKTQYFYSALDTLGLCQFDWGPAWQLYGPEHLADYVNAVTGWNVTLDELMTVGRRRLNMLRAFNAREGIGRDADKLTKRLHQMLTDEPNNGLQITPEELEQAKDLYYEMAGWDTRTGYPTAETLAALGLEWIPGLP